ncbi:hypothetical protein QA645_24690 [Bradyrhizobium sp. CIAT3101]|uniref:hypothetical protein n=1 Tax=Bradyrhizobium sp. CIAT3101 TaxID=439387 RepID=UPI0024B12599|nr:hypothetical protein [Bradyrhizobium sp. CIAT3101]WFU77748.1 hypothetical protein QA645_24690 [Bradyrhizobium sp. CIAT3101]
MVNLGKWYDPISERWIAPRELHPVPTSRHASENHVLELQRSVEIQRIWRTVVDCCARN